MPARTFLTRYFDEDYTFSLQLLLGWLDCSRTTLANETDT